jgi:hypothetical protein
MTSIGPGLSTFGKNIARAITPTPGDKGHTAPGSPIARPSTPNPAERQSDDGSGRGRGSGGSSLTTSRRRAESRNAQQSATQPANLESALFFAPAGFAAHAVTEYSTENINFLLASVELANALADSPIDPATQGPFIDKRIHLALRAMVNKFIRAKSEFELNIEAATRRHLVAFWDRLDSQFAKWEGGDNMTTPPASARYLPVLAFMDAAITEVVNVMKVDTFKRYVDKLPKIKPANQSAPKLTILKWPPFLLGPGIAQSLRSWTLQTQLDPRPGPEPRPDPEPQRPQPMNLEDMGIFDLGLEGWEKPAPAGIDKRAKIATDGFVEMCQSFFGMEGDAAGQARLLNDVIVPTLRQFRADLAPDTLRAFDDACGTFLAMASPDSDTVKLVNDLLETIQKKVSELTRVTSFADDVAMGAGGPSKGAASSTSSSGSGTSGSSSAAAPRTDASPRGVGGASPAATEGSAAVIAISSSGAVSRVPKTRTDFMIACQDFLDTQDIAEQGNILVTRIAPGLREPDQLFWIEDSNKRLLLEQAGRLEHNLPISIEQKDLIAAVRTADTNSMNPPHN